MQHGFPSRNFCEARVLYYVLPSVGDVAELHFLYIEVIYWQKWHVLAAATCRFPKIIIIKLWSY